jgi:hypothetical protein
MTGEFPCAAAEVTTLRVRDETFLHHRARREVHVLNAAAGRVWSACDGRRDVRALAELLRADAADAPPPAAVEADVRALLGELARRGLLAGAGPAPAERDGARATR